MRHFKELSYVLTINKEVLYNFKVMWPYLIWQINSNLEPYKKLSVY